MFIFNFVVQFLNKRYFRSKIGDIAPLKWFVWCQFRNCCSIVCQLPVKIFQSLAVFPHLDPPNRNVNRLMSNDRKALTIAKMICRKGCKFFDITKPLLLCFKTLSYNRAINYNLMSTVNVNCCWNYKSR
jgi:hypothetical protein